MTKSINVPRSSGFGSLYTIITAILLTQIILSAIIFSIITTGKERASIGGVSVLSKSDISKWADTCDSPCFLPAQYRGGGNLLWFQNAAFILMDQNKQLVIDHDVCISACTIIVDTMQMYGGNVCIAPQVLMGLHRGSKYDQDDKFTGYFDYEYLNPVIRQFLIDNLTLDPEGEVSFLASDNWSVWWPMCKKDYSPRPAMEDGGPDDYYSLP